jgi:hypothetical protein
VRALKRGLDRSKSDVLGVGIFEPVLVELEIRANGSQRTNVGGKQ